MLLKRKSYTPREYIQVGIAFFMVGLLVNQFADGRMIGSFLASLLHDESLLQAFKDFSAGLSIPILCISIFFNVRGLIAYRSR